MDANLLELALGVAVFGVIKSPLHGTKRHNGAHGRLDPIRENLVRGLGFMVQKLGHRAQGIGVRVGV